MTLLLNSEGVAANAAFCIYIIAVSKLYHWHILSNQCWCTGVAGVTLMEAGVEAAVVGVELDVVAVGIHRLPFNFSFFEIDLLTITFT